MPGAERARPRARAAPAGAARAPRAPSARLRRRSLVHRTAALIAAALAMRPPPALPHPASGARSTATAGRAPGRCRSRRGGAPCALGVRTGQGVDRSAAGIVACPRRPSRRPRRPRRATARPRSRTPTATGTTRTPTSPAAWLSEAAGRLQAVIRPRVGGLGAGPRRSDAAGFALFFEAGGQTRYVRARGPAQRAVRFDQGTWTGAGGSPAPVRRPARRRPGRRDGDDRRPGSAPATTLARRS